MARCSRLAALGHDADVAAEVDLFAAVLTSPEDVPRPRRNCSLAGRGHANVMDASTMISEE